MRNEELPPDRLAFRISDFGFSRTSTSSLCTLDVVESDIREIQILRYELCEVDGRWADNVQMFFGDGVGEAQCGCMEQRPLRQVGSLRVVEAIAEDWVSGGGEVNPHLVRATGDEAAADHRKTIFERRQNLEFGARGPAAVVALKPPAVIAIAANRAINDEGFGLGMALDHGQIEPFDLAAAPGV